MTEIRKHLIMDLARALTDDVQRVVTLRLRQADPIATRQELILIMQAGLAQALGQLNLRPFLNLPTMRTLSIDAFDGMWKAQFLAIEAAHQAARQTALEARTNRTDCAQ